MPKRLLSRSGKINDPDMQVFGVAHLSSEFRSTQPTLLSSWGSVRLENRTYRGRKVCIHFWDHYKQISRSRIL